MASRQAQLKVLSKRSLIKYERILQHLLSGKGSATVDMFGDSISVKDQIANTRRVIAHYKKYVNRKPL